MKSLLLAIVFAVGLRAQLTPAAQWFLDNSSGLGNNANNCTARATPCLTVAGVLAKSIQAGDLVAVRCTGTIFREEFIPPANNVKLTTYDCASLAAPIFDAADIISAGAWFKTGGLTVTYQAPSLPVAVVGDSWVNAWENSTQLIYESSTALVDATPGSYFPSSITTSPITLYVHATDGSNPASNGKTYTYTNRQAGYDSSGVTGAQVYGIVTQNNSFAAGSLVVGQGGVAVNVTVNNGSKHNVYYMPQSTLYNVTASGAYYGGGLYIMFILNANSALSTDPATRCTLCIATLPATDVNGTAFYGHLNGAGTLGPVIFDRNTGNNVGSWGIAGQSRVVFYNGVFNGVPTSGLTVAGGWLVNGLSGTMLTAGFNNHFIDYFGGSNIEISNITATGGNAGIFMQSFVRSGDLYIHDTSLGVSLVYNNGSSGVNLKFRNNTIQNATCCLLIDNHGSVASIDSDLNIFNATVNVAHYPDVAGSPYYTQAQWQAFGYDLHSTF